MACLMIKCVWHCLFIFDRPYMWAELNSRRHINVTIKQLTRQTLKNRIVFFFDYRWVIIENKCLKPCFRPYSCQVDWFWRLDIQGLFAIEQRSISHTYLFTNKLTWARPSWFHAPYWTHFAEAMTSAQLLKKTTYHHTTAIWERSTN